MKWKALLKDVKGDHLVSRDANFAFIQKFVCKTMILMQDVYIFSNMYTYIYRYIYYIYIYVCVCVRRQFFLFLGWGEGRWKHITEADGIADLEVEHNKSWSCFLRMATILLQISVPCANFWMEELAIDHLEMDAVRHAFAYLYTKYTNCILVNI